MISVVPSASAAPSAATAAAAHSALAARLTPRAVAHSAVAAAAHSQGMTRGFAPQPPGRGRGRGCGRGQVVRPPTHDASNVPEASSQPLPTPLAASAPDEPPQSPLGDPTPLGPSTTTPMTSQGGAGGSFTPSPSPSFVSHPPAAPQHARKFITLAEAKDDRDFYSCIGSVISGHFTEPWPIYKKIPESQKNFWFEELKVRIYCIS
ncbi:hypothetical protein Salat_2112700 [Sesamum alatum]|uniref:Uncharacterized protein n=1 Tax=Sesamum alatum TaxID=300844 RepID=A0AAE1Y1N3_9LAMI|nr:hypothetical protein Salat_2112700 [Sesamum alatum]